MGLKNNDLWLHNKILINYDFIQRIDGWFNNAVNSLVLQVQKDRSNWPAVWSKQRKNRRVFRILFSVIFYHKTEVPKYWENNVCPKLYFQSIVLAAPIYWTAI